jgi:hypothetical protein
MFGAMVRAQYLAGYAVWDVYENHIGQSSNFNTAVADLRELVRQLAFDANQHACTAEVSLSNATLAAH